MLIMKFYIVKITDDLPCDIRESEYCILKQLDWDDYSIRSSFELSYYKNGQSKYIGKLKIITKRLTERVRPFNVVYVANVLENRLDRESEPYYSLGQNFLYYKNLYETFPDDFGSILEELKDTAYYPQYREESSRLGFDFSLIRDKEAQKIQRELHLKLFNPELNANDYYKFSFIYTPEHMNGSAVLRFDISNELYGLKRIYAIVGENGVGKTKCLQHLIQGLSRNDMQVFRGRIPVFGKILCINHNPFDDYEPPSAGAAFNFVWCSIGFRAISSVGDSYRNQAVESIAGNFIQMAKIDRIDYFFELIEYGLIPVDLPDSIQCRECWTPQNIQETCVNLKNYAKELSTGKLASLYLYSTLISSITHDSLVIIDEPECNLHPRAITQSINALYKILSKFDSYCILATHSPYVVRELPSQNVYIMRNVDSSISVESLDVETFGGNIALLSESIFRCDFSNVNFKHILKRVYCGQNNNYDDTCRYFEQQGVKLSIEAKLYLNYIAEH